MKKNPFYILIPSVFIIALTSCGEKDAPKKSAPILPYPVVEVAKRDITTFESYPTAIEGEINSQVRPKISGYIKDVLVHEGQKVKKGQLLFRLETQTLSQDAEAAKASINAAQVEVDRLMPLIEKKIISEVQLETAKAQLAKAKSVYNSIGANIDYANIKSPVDGVVGSINYRNGALVSGQDPMPLTNVSSIENVFAYFSMNEKEFINFMEITEGKTEEDKLKNFPAIELILANGKVYEKTGRIETITGDINKQIGSLTFRVKFNNESGVLRNGSSGTIRLPRTYKEVMIIPAESTFERQGKSFVYKVLNDSLVDKPIVVLKESNRLYIVGEGLTEGEVILAKGLTKVSPGIKIIPQKQPLDSIINSFKTLFK